MSADSILLPPGPPVTTATLQLVGLHSMVTAEVCVRLCISLCDVFRAEVIRVNSYPVGHVEVPEQDAGRACRILDGLPLYGSMLQCRQVQPIPGIRWSGREMVVRDQRFPRDPNVDRSMITNPAQVLFVSNLPPDSALKDIADKFVHFGNAIILNTTMLANTMSALVQLASLEDAVSALIGLQGVPLKGLPMRLHFPSISCGQQYTMAPPLLAVSIPPSTPMQQPISAPSTQSPGWMTNCQTTQGRVATALMTPEMPAPALLSPRASDAQDGPCNAATPKQEFMPHARLPLLTPQHDPRAAEVGSPEVAFPKRREANVGSPLHGAQQANGGNDRHKIPVRAVGSPMVDEENNIDKQKTRESPMWSAKEVSEMTQTAPLPTATDPENYDIVPMNIMPSPALSCPDLGSCGSAHLAGFKDFGSPGFLMPPDASPPRDACDEADSEVPHASIPEKTPPMTIMGLLGNATGQAHPAWGRPTGVGHPTGAEEPPSPTAPTLPPAACLTDRNPPPDAAADAPPRAARANKYTYAAAEPHAPAGAEPAAERAAKRDLPLDPTAAHMKQLFEQAAKGCSTTGEVIVRLQELTAPRQQQQPQQHEDEEQISHHLQQMQRSNQFQHAAQAPPAALPAAAGPPGCATSEAPTLEQRRMRGLLMGVTDYMHTGHVAFPHGTPPQPQLLPCTAGYGTGPCVLPGMMQTGFQPSGSAGRTQTQHHLGSTAPIGNCVAYPGPGMQSMQAQAACANFIPPHPLVQPLAPTQFPMAVSPSLVAERS